MLEHFQTRRRDGGSLLSPWETWLHPLRRQEVYVPFHTTGTAQSRDLVSIINYLCFNTCNIKCLNLIIFNARIMILKVLKDISPQELSYYLHQKFELKIHVTLFFLLFFLFLRDSRNITKKEKLQWNNKLQVKLLQYLIHTGLVLSGGFCLQQNAEGNLQDYFTNYRLCRFVEITCSFHNYYKSRKSPDSIEAEDLWANACWISEVFTEREKWKMLLQLWISDL